MDWQQGWIVWIKLNKIINSAIVIHKIYFTWKFT